MPLLTPGMAFMNGRQQPHHWISYASSDVSIDGHGFPDLVVFDLDMCAWSPEMYMLNEIPTREKDSVEGKLYPDDPDPVYAEMEGVVGARSGYDTIRLFPHTRRVMRDYYNGIYPENMRLAAASSADTPKAVRIGRGAMKILEVLPGVTVEDVFRKGWEDDWEKGYESNMQIGRTSPLSSDKSRTHFPILREKTGVPYHRMLFFDDSVWSDHCQMVALGCREEIPNVGEWGVVTQETPRGFMVSEWESGLKKFANQATAISNAQKGVDSADEEQQR